MDDFEQLLDECLQRIADGRSSVEESLALHPEYASQLEPLLLAAARFQGSRALAASTAYKVSARERVMEHARTHPPRPPRMRPAWRMLAAMAVLVLVVLMTTTAFAQDALPGETLYGWKLSSEQVWRSISPDPLGVDLSLADRRAQEVTDVARNAGLTAEALNGYHEVLSRLQAEDNQNNRKRIKQALEPHEKRLSAAGIHDKQLNEIIHGKP